MAFDKWTLGYSALLLLVSSIGNIDAQSCGGTYTSKYGVFMSPNYPNVYNVSYQCTYTISLSTVSSITLNFETFELDRSSGDYVSITCNSNSSFAQKTYDWNDNIPPISIPWCSSGRLYFYSDPYRYYSTRGFRVQYQTNTKACGNTVFTSSSGTISSPNYPKNYNNNENCTYSIWAPTSSSFTLTFQAFRLESVSDCRYDWVQISCDNSSYILPKYCGSTLPKPAYIRNCNKALIWFQTDNGVVYSGFSLQYSVTPDGCGKSSYAGLSGIITSPNYPKGQNSMSCYYYLYPVSSVALAFQSFDLEPFIDSSNGDYVKIDCYSNSSDAYRYYRGNTLPPLISYQLCSSVRIYFDTNNALFGTGFNLRYQVNPLVAHSAITNAPKSFTVDVGARVQLDCTSDATDYYPSWTLNKDGTDENTTIIASFCVVNSDYYSSQYTVVKGGPGVCNLVITSAVLAEAGVYTCIDVGLSSVSSVVTVMVPTTTPAIRLSDQGQTDSDVVVIVLSVLLAICILGYIGEVLFFIVHRYRETPRVEGGQRNTNPDIRLANHSAETQATRSANQSAPISVVSAQSSTRNNERRNRVDNPPPYDTVWDQMSHMSDMLEYEYSTLRFDKVMNDYVSNFWKTIAIDFNTLLRRCLEELKLLGFKIEQFNEKLCTQHIYKHKDVHQKRSSRANEDLYCRERVETKTVSPEDDEVHTTKEHRKRVLRQAQRTKRWSNEEYSTGFSHTTKRTTVGLPTTPTTSVYRGQSLTRETHPYLTRTC